jgi:hypothetical protein
VARRRIRLWRGSVVVTSRTPGRAQSTLGIQQEDTRGDNAVPFGQTRAHFHAIGELHAERDGARLEPIPDDDKDVLLSSGVDDGVPRHSHRGEADRGEGGGPVESGPERASGVRGGHAHAQRAGAFSQRGVEKLHTGCKRRAPGRRKVEARHHARPHGGNAGFGYLGEHPDP